MSTLASNQLHESRVRYISVVYACGHIRQVKVSPAISDAYLREIRREAKQRLCSTCRTVAAVKALNVALPAGAPEVIDEKINDVGRGGGLEGEGAKDGETQEEIFAERPMTNNQ